ncbi:MAG: M56 family metallopeptidase [Fimbriimonas sp.]
MLWFAARSALVFALAFGITAAMRRRSASERHLVWLAAFVAVAAMPLFASGPRLIQVAPPPVAAGVLAPVLPSATVDVKAHDTPVATVTEAVSPVASHEEPLPASSFAPWATLYWVGFGLCLFRFAFGVYRLRRAVRHSRLVRAFSGHIHIRQVDRGLLGSPATFGWPRASILFPAESEGWPVDRQEIALAHEVAHVERADWVWQCFALAICSVQWFNPLAWFAAGRMRAEAEAAADDAVLRRGLAPSLYAQELLTLAHGLRRETTLAVPIARPGGVASRVRAILARDRDRRPAAPRVRWAAGTGTFFLAAMLGGVGVSAVVANAPLPQELPFQFQTKGGAFNPMHSFAEVAGNSLGIMTVQHRPLNGKTEAWDGMGRPMMPLMPVSAPRPIEIPGRKIREIAVTCPPLVNLEVELPEGADLIHLIRYRHVALLAASFPSDAKVTSLRLGIPKVPGAFLRDVAVEADSGPRGRPTWPRVQWYAVPRSPQPVRYLPVDGDGKPIPVVAQFAPRRDSKILIAVAADQAPKVRRIQMRTLVAEWHTYGNLILDPAPPIATRPNAPVATVPLLGGGKASVVHIESITPGRPYRVWAVDGGAPRTYDTSLRQYGGQWEPGGESRIVEVHLQWPKPLGSAATVTWKADKPLDYRGGGTSATPSSVPVVAQVQVTMPSGHKEAQLHMGYAYEPWREFVQEGIGGARLRASAKRDPNYMVSSQPVTRVAYTPPAEVQAMDMVLEAFDARGKPLKGYGSSGPATVNGKVDPERSANFLVKSPGQIARLRLKVRPLHWVTLPPVPLYPK